MLLTVAGDRKSEKNDDIQKNWDIWKILGELEIRKAMIFKNNGKFEKFVGDGTFELFIKVYEKKHAGNPVGNRTVEMFMKLLKNRTL